MTEFEAKDLEVSGYPPAPIGGMQTGKIPWGVHVKHIPTGLTAICTDHRHQHINRHEALAVLKKLVDEHLNSNAEQKV